MARGRELGSWSATAGAGGWVRVGYTGADGEEWQLLVRAQPDESGRLRIVELYMGGGAPITAEALHNVRLGAIEGILNQPYIRDGRLGVLAKLEDESAFDTKAARKLLLRAASSRKLAKDVDAVTSHFEARPKLSKPAGRNYGDSFYRQVADAFRHAQWRGAATAPAIADEAGVPNSTALRWIREARQRGFLHPGQRKVPRG